MPLYHFQCPKCQRKERKLLKSEDVSIQRHCGVCGAVLEREVKGPTSQIVEVLDNGLMPRKLTRIADAERIYKERSSQYDRDQEENK